MHAIVVKRYFNFYDSRQHKLKYELKMIKIYYFHQLRATIKILGVSIVNFVFSTLPLFVFMVVCLIVYFISYTFPPFDVFGANRYASLHLVERDKSKKFRSVSISLLKYHATPRNWPHLCRDSNRIKLYENLGWVIQVILIKLYIIIA